MQKTLHHDVQPQTEETAPDDALSGGHGHFQVPPESAGERFDHFLVQKLTDLSRSEITRLIRSGAALLNGKIVKPGQRLHSGDQITLTLAQQGTRQHRPRPADISFSTLYEDQSILVIDKPAGLVVHPAEGHWQDTLVNGLLSRYTNLPGNDPLRPGIVHRLDKDTSGVLVIAKTAPALKNLCTAFKDRKVQKTYHAVLLRSPTQNAGRIVAPIGRHPVKRQKMAVLENGGRYAATRWQVLAARPGFSFVEIELETGRTHQIRVHMASLGAPIAGDTVYGGGLSDIEGLPVRRQLLHASTICFTHPETGKTMRCTAPLPPDMQQIVDLFDDGQVTEHDTQ